MNIFFSKHSENDAHVPLFPHNVAVLDLEVAIDT